MTAQPRRRRVSVELQPADLAPVDRDAGPASIPSVAPEQPVAASAAVQQIVPILTVGGVVTTLREQFVAAHPSCHHVGVCAAVELVGSTPSVKGVGPGSPGYEVAADVSVCEIGTRRGIDPIGPDPTVEPIPTARTVELVASTSAGEPVSAGVSKKGVSAGSTCEKVGFVASDEPVRASSSHEILDVGANDVAFARRSVISSTPLEVCGNRSVLPGVRDRVPATHAAQPVGAGAAHQQVGLRGASQTVGATAPIEAVPPSFPLDPVAPRTSTQQVLPRRPDQGVVASSARHHVRSRCAREGVVPAVSPECGTLPEAGGPRRRGARARANAKDEKRARSAESDHDAHGPSDKCLPFRQHAARDDLPKLTER